MRTTVQCKKKVTIEFERHCHEQNSLFFILNWRDSSLSHTTEKISNFIF